MSIDPGSDSALPGIPPPDDPFRYGYRFVTCTRPDGTEEHDHVPLTLEDVLHPQEDDTIAENTVHNLERDYLASVFRSRLVGVRGALVLSDCLIDWGVEDIRPMSPDNAVLFDVTDPGEYRGTFHVADEKTGPVQVIEIVSPHTRDNDVNRKRRYYHQLGIPLYIIVDQVRERGPRTLIPYRYTPEHFERMPLDAQGCVYLEAVHVRLGLQENRLICYDPDTGEEIGDYTQVEQLRQAEHQARLDAERREEEEARARREAERQAREQTQARELAERQARERAIALEEAQRREQELNRAREETDRKAQLAAQAQKDAEQRIRDLEAKLRELEGQTPGSG